MARDLYSILGVAKTADEDQIKKAFRKLAVQYHPDKNPGKANEERFKEINRANEVLGNKEKRSLYDEFGDESLQQGFDPERARMMKNFARGRGGGPAGFQEFFVGGNGQGFGGGDVGDIFGDIFSRQRGRAPRPQKAPDHEASVSVPLVDALRGTMVTLGSRGPGEPVTVRIPAGVSDGGRVKVEGQGAQVPGAQPGDLYIIVKVEPHPFLRREGEDLHMEVPISLVEAFEGAKIRVPTLDGEVALKVPARTQSGQILRLRGKGVARKGRPTGDLYVKFLIRIPEGDSPELAKAIEDLRPLTGDPRIGFKL